MTDGTFTISCDYCGVKRLGHESLDASLASAEQAGWRIERDIDHGIYRAMCPPCVSDRLSKPEGDEVIR